VAAHWAKTDYSLSAGQHAVLPEGKGKGKGKGITDCFVTATHLHTSNVFSEPATRGGDSNLESSSLELTI